MIVGAGGHGLATAYYLAKNHGSRDVAVLEKGWLGGGNTGRNTTIIRSNYLQPASAAIYEKARALYETLSQELNFNVMFSPRGVLMLAQTEHELRAWKRTAHANRAARASRASWSAATRIARARADPEPRRPALSGARRRSGSRAAAPRATTRSPGAMRGRRARWASTSSRTAR